MGTLLVYSRLFDFDATSYDVMSMFPDRVTIVNFKKFEMEFELCSSGNSFFPGYHVIDEASQQHRKILKQNVGTQSMENDAIESSVTHGSIEETYY